MRPILTPVAAAAALSVAVASGLPAAALAQAQTQPTLVAAAPSAAEALPIDQVTVKGQALRTVQAQYSSTVFDNQALRDQQLQSAQDMLRWVPGMNVRNYGLGGVADTVTLRGFGGGGHGGDIGYVLDGISLNEAMSHADGYADINVVVPLEIDSMTVLRGPISPLYGNYARGGVIVLDTRRGGNYRQADLSIGSNATVDAQVALGLQLAPGQTLNLAAQGFRTDGFRPQSDTERGTASARWTADLASGVQFMLSGRLHQGDADSAAYLTPAQFETDPYGIDPRVRKDGAEKHFGTLRADLHWLLSPEVKLLTDVYTTRQDFVRWYSRSVASDPAADWAQREESYDRTVWGAGLSLNGRHRVTGVAVPWTAGIETTRESTDYTFYDNLNDRVRTGPAQYDRRATLNNVAAFAEVEADIHPLFKPTLGLRYDRFTGQCSKLGSETGTNPCSALATTDHLSPKLGLRADVLPSLKLRASWAEGFALPSDFIKYALGASNLDPNVFRQTEIGANWTVGPVRLDLASYRLNSTQEIRTVSTGVYENLGSTLRTGWEASLSVVPLDDLELTLALATADSEVRENANAALIGMKVAGVPKTMTTLGLAWAPPQGLGASATLRDVGRYATNATNTAWYDGFTTLDLALTYGGRVDAFGAKLNYRAYLRVDNATDKVYATNYSTTVAPGAPRTLRLGAQLDF